MSGNKPVKTHRTYESQTVANDQRKMVYAQRDSLLDTDDVSETITDFCAEVVNTLIHQFIPPESLEEQVGCEGVGIQAGSV